MRFNQCYKVNNADEIIESYCYDVDRVVANVSKDKLLDVINCFICNLAEPMFLILEAPCTLDEEAKLRTNDYDPMHKNVYYMDGCSAEEMILLFNKHSDILFGSGLASFGVASHVTHEEMMIGRYNSVYIFNISEEKADRLFKTVDIPKVDRIIVAQDTFCYENPGEARMLDVNGKNIYTLVDELKNKGLYLGETVED